MSPQSTKTHPESISPSTPRILNLFSFSDSTSFSETDRAWRFEVAVAIMILSANDEMFSTSKTSKSSALLSVRLLLHISESVFLEKIK